VGETQVTAFSTNSGWQGVNVAAITPRGNDGNLNFGATFELLDYLGAARVGSIALFTACGEYPALALDDRARLMYLAVKRSRVPVVAGVGSATLHHSLELAREGRSAGASAILLPPPLFYGCDPDDLHEFYSQFAAQLGGGVPIFLGGGLDTETACALLRTGRFAGMEHSASAMENLEQLRGCAAGLTVLSSHDALFVAARRGGLGTLSAAACAAPELVLALTQAIASGDSGRIAPLAAKHQELIEWLDRFPAPAGVKTAVSLRGIRTGPLLVPLSPAKQKNLEQFREWFGGWLPATRKLAAHA
jgi:4-hydroxy-tetrahydrodipicolinate synthase